MRANLYFRRQKNVYTVQNKHHAAPQTTDQSEQELRKEKQ